MLNLTREHGDLIFGHLALGYVYDQVHGAQESARRAEERGRIRNQRPPRAIGAFDYGLQAANGSLLLDRYGHRTLIVRKLTTIRPEELPGTAPPILAKLRAPSPNIGGSLIEVGHVSLCIRHVDGGRQY